jgi:hypothetical protein
MHKSGGQTPQAPRRRDRLIQSKRHDPYRAKRKLPDPTACPECGAVYHQGRWCWGHAPAEAPRHTCPACQRIQDGYPAGHVTAKGDFTPEQLDELRALARNVESREKGEHPLHRIMDARTEQHALVITTTDVHLARTLGQAFQAAYQGDLEQVYSEQENLIRVTWSR